jgi:NADP-dependent alcohol dehydrogenase
LIDKTRSFFESIGLPTRLSSYGAGAATEAARRLAARGLTAMGERGDITPPTVEKILRLAA